MTAHVISSAQSSGYSLMSGDTLTVLSGGYDSGSIIGKGAKEFVSSGGSAHADQIASGGIETVFAGGEIDSFTVSAGGVLSGASTGLVRGNPGAGGGNDVFGTVDGLTVAGDVTLNIDSGGLDSGSIVSGSPNSYDGIFVLSGARAIGDTVEAGGQLILSAGGVASNTMVQLGGVVNANGGALTGVTSNAGSITSALVSGSVIVQAGGVDTRDTILSKGVVSVASGGTVDYFELQSGGSISGAGAITGNPGAGNGNDVYGKLIGLTVTGDATLNIDSGGVDSGTFVSGTPNSYDGIFVAAGGSAVGVTVGSGGQLNLGGGGGATATTVQVGGYIDAVSGVLLGASVDAGIISNGVLSGTLEVQAGGYTYGLHVLSGSIETVDLGASVADFTVSSGAVLKGSGSVADNPGTGNGNDVYGTVSGLTVTGDVTLNIDAGGVDSGTFVSASPNSYDGIFIESGAKAIGDIVGAGGQFSLSAGGVASNTTVQAGATVNANGGALRGTTQDSGVVNSAVISGTIEVASGGSDARELITANGVEIVSAGGTAQYFTVAAGGLLSGAGAVLGNPGTGDGNDVYGTVRGLTVTGDVILNIDAGGVDSGTFVSASPNSYDGIFIESGAKAIGDTVGAGGQFILSAGGVASNTTVQAGATVNANGGALEGTTHDSGAVNSAVISGTIEVASGGSDARELIAANSVESVSAGGTAQYFTVASGGLLSGAGAVLGNPGTGNGNDVYGMVSGLTVTGDVILNIDAGGVDSGTFVSASPNSYDGIFVYAGGSTVGVTVGMSGQLNLSGGGSAASTVVQAGGYIDAVNGTLLGATLDAGTISNGSLSGTLQVQAGGVTVGLTVLSGGAETVDLGATVNGFDVAKGGLLKGAGAVTGNPGPGGGNDDYGTISGLTLTGDTTINVDSGGVDSGTLTTARDQSYDGIFVYASGSAVHDQVGSGGYLTVESGGAAAATVIQSNGVEYVSAGGSIAGGTISAGGLLSGAATATGSVLSNLSGGTDNGTTFLSGAVNLLDAGGVDVGVTISSGGKLELGGLVVSGGSKLTLGVVKASTSISGDTLLSGAIENASGSIVLSGGVEVVSSGAETYAAIISSGGLLSGAGGYASALVVESKGTASGSLILLGASVDHGLIAGASLDGTLEVTSGGVESGGVVREGAVETIDKGGVASATTISSGSTQVLLGSAYGVQVRTAGVQSVGSGAVDDAVKVSAGGSLVVLHGGVASGAVVLGSTTVASGGSIVAGEVESGARAIISAGGSISDTLLRTASDSIYGSAYGDKLSSGGVEVVLAGGVDHSATVLSSGALQVNSGGSASGILVSGGGKIAVFAGGSATLTYLRSGTESMYGFGDDAKVSAGGIEIVESGGSDNAASVFASGQLKVTSGGAANGVSVASGGLATVSAGGSVLNTAVSAGGQLLDDGQAAFSADETFAGTLTGSGTLLVNGGRLVLSGAESGFSGQSTIDAGTLELATSQGAGTGVITFASVSSTAVLQLDAADTPAPGGTFARKLANFSQNLDRVDLAGLAYVSGATATLSGSKLTLKDGASSYVFNLQGTTAPSYEAISDGHGGTLIVAEKGSGAQALIQAAASFGAERATPVGTSAYVASEWAKDGLAPSRASIHRDH